MSAAAQTLPDPEHDWPDPGRDWLHELATIMARLDELPPAAQAAVRKTAEAILDEASEIEAARAVRLLEQIAPGTERPARRHRRPDTWRMRGLWPNPIAQVHRLG